MLYGSMMVFVLQLATPSASSGDITFHRDHFGAGFHGDAVYFVSRTPAGEEMTVLVADTPDLCEAIKSRRADKDIRIWVAEFTERTGAALKVNTGTHVILTDSELYDDSFAHKGGVAMLAYMHKRAGAGRAPAFVGMAARGYLDITSFDGGRASLSGHYRATFQLGYNQAGGWLEVAGTGRFEAKHCPEGIMWQQALLG